MLSVRTKRDRTHRPFVIGDLDELLTGVGVPDLDLATRVVGPGVQEHTPVSHTLTVRAEGQAVHHAARLAS
jgi:hypothetical protein